MNNLPEWFEYQRNHTTEWFKIEVDKAVYGCTMYVNMKRIFFCISQVQIVVQL